MRIVVFAVTCAALACGSAATPAPTPPPCDQKCQDGVAVKALREMAKLAFNVSLQGKPVGAHDETRPCPLGGSVRVRGTATSNALQGATEVDLTYEFTGCAYNFDDDDADDNYTMKLDGALTQVGVIGVQPTATSALVLRSEKMIMGGKVYDPPIDYAAECPIELGQNGNRVTGRLCGRDVVAEL